MKICSTCEFPKCVFQLFFFHSLFFCWHAKSCWTKQSCFEVLRCLVFFKVELLKTRNMELSVQLAGRFRSVISTDFLAAFFFISFPLFSLAGQFDYYRVVDQSSISALLCNHLYYLELHLFYLINCKQPVNLINDCVLFTRNISFISLSNISLALK